MAKGGSLSKFLFSKNPRNEDAELMETLLNDCGLLPSEKEAIVIYSDAKAAGMSEEAAEALAGISMRKALSKMFSQDKKKK